MDFLAFKLAQLGSLSAQRWADRMAGLGLTPSEGMVLRMLGAAPLSQRELAGAVGVVPSRIVAVVDALEERGLVDRVRSASDRRRYELTLTHDGAARLADLRTAGAGHERELVAELSPAERAELATLLDRLVEIHGLRPGVHPEVGR